MGAGMRFRHLFSVVVGGAVVLSTGVVQAQENPDVPQQTHVGADGLYPDPTLTPGATFDVTADGRGVGRVETATTRRPTRRKKLGKRQPTGARTPTRGQLLPGRHSNCTWRWCSSDASRTSGWTASASPVTVCVPAWR